MDEWGKGFVGELDYREEAYPPKTERVTTVCNALKARNALLFQQDIAKTPLAGAASLAALKLIIAFPLLIAAILARFLPRHQ